MRDTMLDVLQKLKARRRLYVQLSFGLLFLGLVGLYTFSHNANLMLAGINVKFQTIGILAACAGEVFMIYAFVVGMFSSGSQKAAALLSDAAMLAVLLANTVIDYASESRHIPETGRWLFELYASYGAPITIVVVLVIGLHFVLHLDYAVRFHSAEIATRMAEQDIETAAMYTARDQMVEEMGSTAHTEKIRQAAADKVTNIIEFISAKKRA